MDLAKAGLYHPSFSLVVNYKGVLLSVCYFFVIYFFCISGEEWNCNFEPLYLVGLDFYWEGDNLPPCWLLLVPFIS